jgi:uncharacterized protein YrrD
MRGRKETKMEFREGASVYTSDGDKAGHLHRVVIDPGSNEITHIVVQKGFLNHEDKVVPMEKVASAIQDEITLLCDSAELKEMSPYEISQYVPARIAYDQGPHTFAVPGMYWDSPDAPSEYYIAEESRHTIEDNLVALKEGAPVVSADDKQVGNVERVITDPASDEVTHFIITQGLLLKSRKVVPIQHIELLEDDKVYLDLRTKEVENLPSFHN